MSADPSLRAQAYLLSTGRGSAELVPIQGDASTRTYFRVVDGDSSLVLLVEPEPHTEYSLPFLSIARFLEKQGLSPPRVIDRSRPLGVLALEDLGDVSLRRALEQSTNRTQRRTLFTAALDILVVLQSKATAALGPETHAWHVRFDASVFRRELSMFQERFVRDLSAITLDAPGEERVTRAFTWLAEELARAPQVLTHRDYHIDNLLVIRGGLRIIDFQDARWGPASYDPASLLSDRDVHRFLAAGETERLLDDFLGKRGIDRDAFQREYRLAVTQRGLKAVGTFADQALRRDRKSYLAYIRPTLDRVRSAASCFPELEEVFALIDPGGETDGGSGGDR